MTVSPAPTFQYAAEILSVHDGDTVTVRVDLGFRTYHIAPLRLYGINAPELSTKPGGTNARLHLISLLADPAAPNQQYLPIVIKTFKNPTDKYGRWLAQIFVANLDVNAQMVIDGHAAPFMVPPA